MSRCSNYNAPGVVVREPCKPRHKVSNAGDARDLIQESRERAQTTNPMSDKEYMARMYEICRDTPGDKSKQLLKARMMDLEHREERSL